MNLIAFLTAYDERKSRKGKNESEFKKQNSKLKPAL